MHATPASKPERTTIGGIKLSAELAQFSLNRTFATPGSFDRILAAIAGRHINIAFLSHTAAQPRATTTFCVTMGHLATVSNIIETAIVAPESFSCIPEVGTVTLYPHRHDLRLIARIIGLFHRHGLPLYGICTSISALSINTRYTVLEQTVERLREIVDLPENHSPLRQQFQVRQLGH